MKPYSLKENPLDYYYSIFEINEQYAAAIDREQMHLSVDCLYILLTLI